MLVMETLPRACNTCLGLPSPEHAHESDEDEDEEEGGGMNGSGGGHGRLETDPDILGDRAHQEKPNLLNRAI